MPVEIDRRDIDPLITALMTFLKDEPKTETELGILGVNALVLGKARTLGLVEHSGHIVWLTSAGERLALGAPVMKEEKKINEL